MKRRCIITFLITSAVTISAAAQQKVVSQLAENKIANSAPLQSDTIAIPRTQLQGPSGANDATEYPAQLQAVLDAMTAELGQIAQAVQAGQISRAQAEYLSLERYYVALTRFQFLRMSYATAEEGTQEAPDSQQNMEPRLSRETVIVPPLTCLTEIPRQIVDYLELKPAQIDNLQGQIADECKQVQPLLEQLDRSRRGLISTTLNRNVDKQQVQALAAEQSRIIKQLLIANSQLETTLYGILTSEQQQKIDTWLRRTLDSAINLPYPEL